MRFSMIIFSMMLIAGCATTDIALTGEEFEPYKGVVKVFYDDGPKEYSEIGIVSSFGAASLVSTAALVKALQKKAAAKGANAIIIKGTDRSGHSSAAAFGSGSGNALGSTTSSGAFASSETTREITAIAIRIER